MMGPDGINETAFLEAAGDAADGTYASAGGLPNEQLTGVGAEWFKKYSEEFGKPETYTVYGYEAANVALAAIESVCKKDRAAILDAVFATKDFDGVLGTWSFDANGDTTLTSMRIDQVTGGEFKFLEIAK